MSLWTAFGSAVGRVVISKSSIAIDDGFFARFNLIQRCSRPLPAVEQNGLDGSNGWWLKPPTHDNPSLI